MLTRGESEKNKMDANSCSMTFPHHSVFLTHKICKFTSLFRAASPQNICF